MGSQIHFDTSDLDPVRKQILDDFQIRHLDYTELETNICSVMGDNLRYCRQALRLSQNLMAKAVGVSLNQYRNYENGRHCMPMSKTTLLAVNIGLPFQNLILGSEYEKRIASIRKYRNYSPLLQSYVGCCGERDYITFTYLLRTELGASLNEIPQFSCAWPDRKIVRIELSRYYLMMAKSVRCFRQLLSLSEVELANLLGVGLSTLLSYERGSLTPQFSVLIALRFWASTGINPLLITCGTNYYRLRYLQNERVTYLYEQLGVAADVISAAGERLLREGWNLNSLYGR